MGSTMFKYALAASLSLSLLVGCAGVPNAMSPAAAGTSIASLKDPAKQAAAQALTTELAVHLQAERTMRGADLVSTSGAARQYGLLHEREGREREGRGRVTINQNVTINNFYGQADQQAAASEKTAKQGFQHMSSRAKQEMAAAIQRRDAKTLEKMAKALEGYLHDGMDDVEAGDDGGKQVTGQFTQGTKVQHQVTVIRKFDADGNLVQSIQKMEGTKDGVTYASTRVRTINPDGTVSVVIDTQMTAKGKTSTVHMEKTIAKDGSFTANGTIKRSDGTTVTLASQGQEDGQEGIAAQDPQTGVKVDVTTDVGSDTAVGKVDAGTSGSAQVPVTVGDQPATQASPASAASPSAAPTTAPSPAAIAEPSPAASTAPTASPAAADAPSPAADATAPASTASN